MLGKLYRSYVDSFRGLPREVWLLSIILLINRSGTMVLPFWALYCTQERGLTPSDAGVLLSIYGIGSIVGNYLGGALSNRCGPLRVQAASMLLTSIGFLILMEATSWNSMIVCLLALSVASEACRPASSSATAAFCPAELHPRAFALNRLAVNLGMTLGPTIGGLLAERSFRFLFMADALSCFLAALVAVWLALKHPARISSSDRHEDATRAGSPWRDGMFLFTLLVLFFLGVCFFQLIGTFALFLRDHYGLGESAIGLTFAVNTIIIVFTEMWLVHSVERFNKLKVMAWSSLFIGAGFGLLAYGTTFAFVAFTVAIWTVGEMLCFPVAMSLVTERSSESNRGTYLGMYGMTFAAASVVAPLIGTWLYERNPFSVWYCCLAVGVVTFAAFWGLAARRKDDAIPSLERVS